MFILFIYNKSEEIPTSNEGAVKVLVGKSFDSEVLNNNKDVLVKFYAPCILYFNYYFRVWTL